MPEELGSPEPYEYTIRSKKGEEQYSFETASGTPYICYFLNIPGFFDDYPSMEVDVVTFGLSLLRESKNFFVEKHDPRIKATVFSILLSAIEVYPERPMLVMYDTQDGRQRSRKITFARWYNECCKLVSKKVTRITISGASMSSADRFDMMMLVPNTCSELEQIKITAMEIKDDLISKGYPPSLECRIECK
ncbi:hypothetical protein [Dyadobacter pollutisoli]|uniref:Uncharacterized protein n=1 Tax=Dyadobacter pollutisoli TaxID=2910158 RepID=A0A9E8SK09_9BACT|nr:hypothetical protein [Dyadobacter pollutisoli]WAC10739.1 hypothetical protein ON006_23720 [Dyadobacter pollutisoli]